MRKESTFIIQIGSSKAIITQGKFNRASWDKMLEDIMDKELVIYSPVYGDPDMGIIWENSNFGPIVKYFSDMISRLYTDDVIKNTTGKLTSQRIERLGIVKDLIENEEFKISITEQIKEIV